MKRLTAHHKTRIVSSHKRSGGDNFRLDTELDLVNKKINALRGQKEVYAQPSPLSSLVEQKIIERQVYVLAPPKIDPLLQERLLYVHQELSQLDQQPLSSGRKITRLASTTKISTPRSFWRKLLV